ncbi:hypothetical protein PsYK624_167550 [Phanerochaete sordida]|uniref:Uncharacterized protein n=1 Tax=Phanerochaete sordida TaxID=48140 RepID=A0A9P3LMD9_9APHY|nr:hypothetical protein PsYK624_167550 [Phanerochaete sordida]
MPGSKPPPSAGRKALYNLRSAHPKAGPQQALEEAAEPSGSGMYAGHEVTVGRGKEGIPLSEIDERESERKDKGKGRVADAYPDEFTTFHLRQGDDPTQRLIEMSQKLDPEARKAVANRIYATLGWEPAPEFRRGGYAEREETRREETPKRESSGTVASHAGLASVRQVSFEDADDDAFFDLPETCPSPQLGVFLTSRAHLPMTACTNAAVKDVNENAQKYKPIKFTNALGVEQKLLNLASLPSELEMTSEEWREAWENYLIVLQGIPGLEPKVVKMFKAHFEHLSRLTKLQNHLPAVLEFDSDTRRRFWTAARRITFTVGSSAYKARLTDFINERTHKMLLGLL